MLKLYNTLTKKKEEFKPLKGKQVGIYTCGPTVYDYIHIGNLRSFLTSDILRRFLEYKGLKVDLVKNITDVGHMFADSDDGQDKILKTAQKEHKSPFDVARFYEQAFLEDEEKFNIKMANVYPRATEHISEMIKLIKQLIEKGYAYVKNGSVYYEVSRFSKYGMLSGNTIENLKSGARVLPKKEKKSTLDFALWKKAEPKRLMQWDSPWGKGYPGWHIECSAMSIKYLGETFDIHTGGEDNVFPHHEDEIAQSEAATGKKFVNFWIHTRHLLVDGQKMSKSLGNFYTLRDLEKKNYSPLALRYLFLTSHYKDVINFTFDSLKSAEKTLLNLGDFIFQIDHGKFPQTKKNPKIQRTIENTKKKFEEFMDDDLNTPKALAMIFEMIKMINKEIESKNFSQKDQEQTKNAIKVFDSVLGFLEKIEHEEEELGDDLKMLIEERENARKAKDWARADALRDQLEEEGIEIEDTPYGIHWKKIKKH